MTKPISISVFFQKGGVGKTTAVFNISYILSKMGFKVIMVDADAQGNLTTQIFPQLSENDGAYEEYNKKLDEEKSKGNLSRINDIFGDSIYGRGGDESTIQPTTPENVAKRVKPLTTNAKDNKNLFYIPGSLKIETLTQPITMGVGGIRECKIYVKMITELFKEVGKIRKADFIIYDLNPSISALNQSIIMNSDYFVMPYQADLGSRDAARNLCEEIPRWYDIFRKVKVVKENEGPILLGGFCQLLRTRKNGETKKIEIEQSYQRWIKQIIEKISQLSKKLNVLNPDQNILSQVPDNIGIRDMVGAGKDILDSGRPFSDVDYNNFTKTRDSGTSRFRKRDLLRVQGANKAYKKVVAMLFANMTTEHKDQLESKVNGFKNKMQCDAAIRLDIEETKKEASKTKPGKRGKRVDRTWYTDDEIDHLFRSFTESTQARDGSNILNTPPLSGDGYYGERDLASEIETGLIRAIGKKDVGRAKLLMPLNIGAGKNSRTTGNHWVLCYISFDENNNDIWYIDPLGNGIPKNISAAIKQSLCNVFKKDINDLSISELNAPVQRDGYNCGPYIVEACRIFCDEQGINLVETLTALDMQLVRRQHKEILEDSRRSNIGSRKKPSSAKKSKRKSKEMTTTATATPAPSTKLKINLRSLYSNSTQNSDGTDTEELEPGSKRYKS